MTKNPARRLGCNDGENQIRNHNFFRDMDWDALEQRKVKPPFRPKVVSYTLNLSNYQNYNGGYCLKFFLQKSARDVLNFDTEFTKEEPVLTPVQPDIVRSINQDEFAGFSFVNTEFGPERKIRDVLLK